MALERNFRIDYVSSDLLPLHNTGQNTTARSVWDLGVQTSALRFSKTYRAL